MGPASAAALAGLFASAFLAGSILPAQSEIVLAALLLAGKHPAWLLVLVATLGNVGGAVLNYALGRAAERFRHRRWFPLSAAGWDRSAALFNRWGLWSLLLSWLPIVGDGFTVLAGAARTPFPLFLTLVTLAKGGRYIVLAAAVAAF
ncbi:YqaA family protein [Sandarakinorhabdus limnophila]|uniref:YqaA family protein n=1 Tax=Sandarakinorhabdus limnophila TaxID=210512 RepID=UPI0026F0BE09|nr:YqaA family protein [Sandarakinorhabdus limnophila]MCM0033447.1 DedA family protein [Sandarakinorhabdus limnophila]